MIANEETSLKATKQVAEVLRIINENEANKASLYSTFAGEVFELVNLFRTDIYGEKSKAKPISKDNFRETLVVAGFGEELQKNDATVNAIIDFLNLTSNHLKESYNFKTQFLANGIEKDNAKKAADAFVQTEKGYLQISFQKQNGKYVWIEFIGTNCGCGERIRDSRSGSWGNWTNNKVKILKPVALKDLTFVENFNNKDDTGKKQFVDDFISSFENFDSFLNS